PEVIPAKAGIQRTRRKPGSCVETRRKAGFCFSGPAFSAAKNGATIRRREREQDWFRSPSPLGRPPHQFPHPHNTGEKKGGQDAHPNPLCCSKWREREACQCVGIRLPIRKLMRSAISSGLRSGSLTPCPPS